MSKKIIEKTFAIFVVIISFIQVFFPSIIASADSSTSEQNQAPSMEAILMEISEDLSDVPYSHDQSELDYFVEHFDSLTLDQQIYGIEVFMLKSDDSKTLLSEFNDLDFNHYSAELIAPISDLISEIRQANHALPELTEEQIAERYNNLPESSTSAESANNEQNAYSTFSTSPAIRNKADVKRVYDRDRYLTSIKISQEGWTTADTVIIANGEAYADVISATPLAHLEKAPILYTKAHEISNALISEIKRLNPTKIILLGGEKSIQPKIETHLISQGFNILRLGGRDRYEAAYEIAEYIQSIKPASAAFLINGEAFADGVSISTYAAQQGQPIYLTRPNELPEITKTAAQEIANWTIVGGTVSVSDAVQNQVTKITGFPVSRMTGRNRYEVNRNIISQYQFNTARIYVASGEIFTDPLAASALAVQIGAPVLLVNEPRLFETAAFANQMNFDDFVVLGGPKTLSEKVIRALRNVKNNGRNFSIYIDIGHGGHDSGAIFGSYKEKDINLSLGLKIVKLFENDPNYEVYVSRRDDHYLSLPERSSEANQLDPDIFLSIHHNAMGGVWAGRARGIETFVQSLRYSTQPRFVTTQPESLKLAEYVHPEVVRVSGLPDRGVRSQNLHVNRETYMPSILIEYGFMDNIHDLRVITTHAYQNKVAAATKLGVDKYFGLK